ncbi:TetR/AcrR family transcriptional regulator [Brevibacillus sp. SYSU BS000544]|uniref:TetR/AcrR family transcriptional regulator n=1 Tax=Brevibacillus sp. SYSU BS000544 TaxID=3416443 RepID=UPI003CE46ACA
MRKDTRMKIIELSYQLFLANGYKQTTTKNIAELSGVNESTIFRIFKNKEVLFHESIAHYTADIMRIDNLGFTYSEDIEQDIYRALRINMELIKEITPSFRLLVKKSIIDDQFLNDIDLKTENLKNYFKQYLIGMQRRGLIRDLDFDALVEFIFGIIFNEALLLNIEEADNQDYSIALDKSCKKYAKYCYELLQIPQPE